MPADECKRSTWPFPPVCTTMSCWHADVQWSVSRCVLCVVCCVLWHSPLAACPLRHSPFNIGFFWVFLLPLLFILPQLGSHGPAACAYERPVPVGTSKREFQHPVQNEETPPLLSKKKKKKKAHSCFKNYIMRYSSDRGWSSEHFSADGASFGGHGIVFTHLTAIRIMDGATETKQT